MWWWTSYSVKETISCFISFILPRLGWSRERVRADNYFALERLQKQSLWRRKTRRKKNFGEEKDGKRAKNFPSSPSCPLSEFCSLPRFYSRTVSNNYFLAQKKSAQLGAFWWMFWKAIISIVFGAFSFKTEENLSQQCVMMIAVRGKFCPKLIY